MSRKKRSRVTRSASAGDLKRQRRFLYDMKERSTLQSYKNQFEAQNDQPDYFVWFNRPDFSFLREAIIARLGQVKDLTVQEIIETMRGCDYHIDGFSFHYMGIEGKEFLIKRHGYYHELVWPLSVAFEWVKLARQRARLNVS